MKPKRILVVDDEPDLVRALGLRLSSRGYEVLTAFDGVQAMSRIQKEHPIWCYSTSTCRPGMDTGSASGFARARARAIGRRLSSP